MHSELCPVCEGSGQWWDPQTNKVRTCHGCGGLGWVAVPDDPYILAEEREEEQEGGEEKGCTDTATSGNVFSFTVPWQQW